MNTPGTASQRQLRFVSKEGILAKLRELLNSPSPVNPQAVVLCSILYAAALKTEEPRLRLTTPADRAPHLDATMTALGMHQDREGLARILDDMVPDLCELTKAHA